MSEHVKCFGKVKCGISWKKVIQKLIKIDIKIKVLTDYKNTQAINRRVLKKR